MPPAAADEKRQEERRIKELRDFQRSNVANRRCFDCNEMMPQYVCLDFNTFVCTACSGIHREFAHRVKSISMSKFTENEVKNMIKFGGNEAAQKYWRNKHDPSFRPNGGNDGERTRNFIRLTYIDRKWVFESPRNTKKEEPEASSSKTSSMKKEKHASASTGDDDFFSSSSKSAKASSSAADGGFAQFGDFSSFENSSATSAPSPSFGDFGDFDSAAPAKKADAGFAEFGDFEGSSGAKCSSTANATPKPTPTPSNFGSFKIAPPPGTHFSSSSTAPQGNDLMGLNPTKKDDDPFGFDTPTAAKEAPSRPTAVASSPFDAFSSPAPTSNPGSRSSSSSLDPFGKPTAAPSVAVQQHISPFDAFGSPAAASVPAFDAFAVSSPAPATGSGVFDAFGGGGDDFGAFTGSSSSSRTNSATVALDPFSTHHESAAPAAAADPFAAFDDMAPPPTSNSSAATSSFPNEAHTLRGNGSQQGAGTDPFAFASGSNSNSIPAAGQVHQQQQFPSGGMSNQPFGGFPGNMGGGTHFPQQQPMLPQNAFSNQMPQHPQPIHQQAPQQQAQQHQWYGQAQGFPGQQQPMHPVGQQYPGQFPSRPGPGGNAPPPAPSQAKASAAVNSIKDPFASLNIGDSFGFTGSSTSSPATARTASGGAANSPPFSSGSRSTATSSFGSGAAPTVSSAPFSYGPAQPRASSSFTFPTQNTAAFADPNAFGDFASASQGSNSSAPAQKPAASANPFDLF